MSNELKNIFIIGVGLIGGSVAKAQRMAQPDAVITAVDVNEDSLELLLECGAINAGFSTIFDVISSGALQDADVIIIATPLQTWVEIAYQLKGQSQLIIDVGSVKQYAHECFDGLPNFAACHPIAGAEFSGAAFATAELFQNKRVILTSNNRQAEVFWQNLGAHCTTMEANQHDLIYAYVSHLPQLAAFAMAEAFLPHLQAEKLSNDAHNFYRLCGSEPTLWQGIFRHNPHMLDSLDTLLRLLGHMIAELETGSLKSDAPVNMQMGLRLTPRIIASCLISSANLSEKKHGINMARYAGTGFASLTHPAMTDPAADLALISEHSGDVIYCLKLFETNLRNLMLAITQKQWHKLQQQLACANKAYQQFIMGENHE